MEKKKKSLGVTVRVASLTAILVASVIVGFNGFRIYLRGMMDHYETYLTSVLNLTMTEIDADDLKVCIETGTKSETFDQTQDFLNRVRETFDIQYIYIVRPLNANDSDNMMNVMAGITKEEIEEDEAFYSVALGETTGTDYSPAVAAKYLEGMETDGITFFRNDTEYGDNYTGQIRICDSAGNPVAMLAADVSIDELYWTVRTYVLTIGAEIILLILIMMMFIYRWLKRRVLEPAGKLVRTTGQFVESSRSTNDPSELVVVDPGIHTGDEMEAMSMALMDMFSDMKRYMSDLVSVTREKERIGAELSVAAAIQSDMLPRIFPPFPNRTEFALYASMNPAKEVGGDFYDFFLIGDDCDGEHGKLGFVIADVSGKGVPAALFMMKAKTQIRDYVESGMELGEAVENANRQLCDGNDAGMFVTAFVGVYDYANGHVDFVNAGHNPPLLWQETDWRWLTEKSGLPLGLFEGLPYQAYSVDCKIGDQFLIYTDGVTEAMDVDGALYGEEQLIKLARANYPLHPRELIECVRRDVARHSTGAIQSDDITILALEVGVPPEITASLIVPADVDELPRVNEFIHTELDRRLCPLRVQHQLDIAVEELFVNVAHYAYPDATQENPGTARISYTYSADPPSITVDIIDEGIPYNPLAKPDAVTPDDIAEVPIGGLGILMAKRSVDEIRYERVDESNVVTIVKKW